MRPVLPAAAVLAAAAAMSAHAEDFVVIESSAPALAVSSIVHQGTPLALPAKARIVLLGASGRVLAIDGPFAGPPPAAAAAAATNATAIDGIKALLTAPIRSGAVGTMRGVIPPWLLRDAIAAPADVMAIDVSPDEQDPAQPQPHDECLADPARAEMIHDPAEAGAMTVQSMTTGEQATLDWPKDQVRQPWPSSVPIADGATYLVHAAGQDHLLTLHVLSGSAEGKVADKPETNLCADQAQLIGAVAQSVK